MIEEMATVRISEAELARDLHAVLEKSPGRCRSDREQDHRPVAVIKTPHRSGRPITQILSEARQRNSTVTLDEDSGADLEEIISRHQREPWNPPSWD
jgi:hypothetical protein